MNETTERELQALARRCGRVLNRGVYLQRASAVAALCLAATASAWVVAKVFLPLGHLAALWSLTALPAVLAGVWIWCRRRGLFFSESEALVVADTLRHNDAELPTRRERPGLIGAPLDLAGRQRLPALSMLPHTRTLAPAVLYFAIVALVPPSEPQASHPNLLLAGQIDEITEYLDADLLNEEVERELQKKVEELKKDEREISPEQWEALSEIQERVAETFAAAETEIASLEEILESMAAGAPSGVSAGEEKLSESGQKLTTALAGVKFFGDKKTLAGLRELAEACQGGAGQGQGEGKGQGKGGAGKKGAPKDLQDRLADLRKKLGQCKSQCSGAGNKPGRGGVNRGRGDAEMDYSAEPRDIDAEFQADLIANEYQDTSYDLGLTFIDPEGEVEQDSRSAEVATSGLQGSGGAIQRTRISPSQKSVVERYFAGE